MNLKFRIDSLTYSMSRLFSHSSVVCAYISVRSIHMLSETKERAQDYSDSTWFHWVFREGWTKLLIVVYGILLLLLQMPFIQVKLKNKLHSQSLHCNDLQMSESLVTFFYREMIWDLYLKRYWCVLWKLHLNLSINLPSISSQGFLEYILEGLMLGLLCWKPHVQPF